MSLFEDFISLIYPRVCLACGNSLFKNEEIICTSCMLHLPKTNYHLEKDNPVSKTFWGRINIETATAYYHYKKGGKVQHLIHRLKYQGYKEVGIFIGKQYGNELMKSRYFNTIDTIIPIPLHKKKQRKRGFNQSEMFAIGLSKSMNATLDTKSIFRAVATETQTRKTRFSRWENVSDIFKIKDAEKLKGKHILLVDDVITTGSTIEACVNILFNIPEVKISVAAIACPIN